MRELSVYRAFIVNTSKVSIISRDCLNGFNDYSSSRSIQLRLGAGAAERRMTSLLFKEEKRRNGRGPSSIGYQLMMMVSRTEITVMSATGGKFPLGE